MTIPRAIRLRWVDELLWELIRFMIKTHTICNLFKIDKDINPKRLQTVTQKKKQPKPKPNSGDKCFMYTQRTQYAREHVLVC